MPDRGPRIAVTPPPIVRSAALRRELEEAFPEVRLNDRGRYLDGEELVQFADGADGLLVGRDALTAEVLARLPRLKIVAKYGVGLDTLDTQALEASGIALGWTGGVNRRSVAELTLGFMLGLCHNLFQTGEALKRGEWRKDGGRVLAGKTVGIVGCGHIGREVVRLLQPFDCRILVRDILDMAAFCRETGCRQAGFEDVLAEADLLTLHVPLNPGTRRMIDRAALGKMKATAFLINTSRGEVVDTAALKEALFSETLAGAALDVFDPEPPDDPDLLAHPRLMVTPHIGGNAVEAVEAMARAAIGHLKEFFQK